MRQVELSVVQYPSEAPVLPWDCLYLRILATYYSNVYSAIFSKILWHLIQSNLASDIQYTIPMYCTLLRSQEYKFRPSNQTRWHHEWTTEENNGYVVFKWKSLDHLGNYREGEGNTTCPAPPPFLRQASGQIDDVNGFSSTSDIFSWMTPNTPTPPTTQDAQHFMPCLRLFLCGIFVQHYSTTVQLFLSCLVK